MLDLNIFHRSKILASAVAVAMLAAFPAATARADHATFLGEILPIFQKHCTECHIPGQQGYEDSGLDMRTYEGVMKGTKHGPIVVPGDGFSSNIMVLIEGRAAPELKMPHGRKELNKWEKLMIRRWINRGALNN
ncbi:MAG: hypothetical protein HQ504_00505 [Rhodospirillaceae bacterium]|nr:hypothetical protein [Rhodospirillaceae bacterium]